MNDYSLTETASRARLAAKGAGYHWGQADEVYRSIFWLVERKLPALSMLKQLLESYKSADDVLHSMPTVTATGFRSRGSFLCPVLLGCALADRTDALTKDSDISFDNVKSPLLLLPFIAELAIKVNRVVVAQLDSEQFSTDGKHVRFSSKSVAILKGASSGKLLFESLENFSFESSESMQLHSRVQIEPSLWQSLDELAHRTYAPASEASRLLGAGAGVQDND